MEGSPGCGSAQGSLWGFWADITVCLRLKLNWKGDQKARIGLDRIDCIKCYLILNMLLKQHTHFSLAWPHKCIMRLKSFRFAAILNEHGSSSHHIINSVKFPCLKVVIGVMNVLESGISLPSPLCGFTVTEWCVCPAGTGRVHGRRCQLLEGGCGASVQPTALLGLGESRPQLRPTVVPNGWSGVAATLPSWTLICMFEKKLELLLKRLWNGWWCLRPYLLCPCRSCLRRCGVGCSILWEDSRPASLTGNRSVLWQQRLMLRQPWLCDCH